MIQLKNLKKGEFLNKMILNVLDIFSGCGGLSYGFHHNPFFKVIIANDIWSTACESYKQNYPNTKIFNKGIQLLSKFDINENIDIIIGGPPCQSFSLAGKKNYNDERGQLYKEYGRILEELQPKLFLFENVSNLLNLDNGQLFYKIVSFFDKLGYRCYSKLLDCSDYGIPTARKRVFLVGIKNPSKDFEFPNQLQIKKITVDDAISDIPLKTVEVGNIAKYLTKPQNEYQNLMRKNVINCEYHHVNIYSDITKERLKYIKENIGTRNDLPANLQYKSGFPLILSRINYGKSAPTLLTTFLNPYSTRNLHPIEPRTISIREAMRIQSFTDDYVLTGTLNEMAKQIGNSVPPLISIHLAKSIEDYFTNSNCVNDDIFQAFG